MACAALSIVLLIGFMLLQAVTGDGYSLLYLYTIQSKTYDCTAVTLLDNKQIDFYISSSVEIRAPKQTWLKNIPESDWKTSTKKLQDDTQQLNKQLHTQMDEFGDTESDGHVLQWRHGCELEQSSGGSVTVLNSINEFGYDGEDLIQFTCKSETWLTPEKKKNREREERWNKLYRYSAISKCEQCEEMLKMYLRYRITEIPAPPAVHIFAKQSVRDSSKLNLTCLATGFYLKDVVMRVRKFGTSIPEHLLTSSGVRPNDDGTYQLRKSVKIPKDDSADYYCYASHSSLTEPVIKQWDGRCTDCSDNIYRGLIIGVLIILLLMLLCPMIFCVLLIDNIKHGMCYNCPGDIYWHLKIGVLLSGVVMFPCLVLLYFLIRIIIIRGRYTGQFESIYRDLITVVLVSGILAALCLVIFCFLIIFHGGCIDCPDSTYWRLIIGVVVSGVVMFPCLVIVCVLKRRKTNDDEDTDWSDICFFFISLIVAVLSGVAMFLCLVILCVLIIIKYGGCTDCSDSTYRRLIIGVVVSGVVVLQSSVIFCFLTGTIKKCVKLVMKYEERLELIRRSGLTTHPPEGPAASPPEGPDTSPPECPDTNPSEGPTASPPEGPVTNPPEGPDTSPPEGPAAHPPEGSTPNPPEGPDTSPPEGLTVSPPEGPAASPPKDPAAHPPEGPAASPPEGPTTNPPEGPDTSPPKGLTVSPPEDPAAHPPKGPAASPPEGPAASPPEGPVTNPPEGPAAIPSEGPAASPPEGPAASPPEGPAISPP